MNGEIELPEGWIWTSIEQITQNFDGKRIPVKSSERKKRQGSYPYYGASGIIDTIDDFLFDGEFLLISEDGANLEMRSTPIAFIARGKFWVNNHAHIVKTKGKIPLKFPEFFLNSFDLQKYLTGSAQPKLTQSNLNKIPIPLPPLAEQRRIVAAVEALLARVNASRERLDRVPGLLKAFRQAVLAAACSGRLTEGWRKEHKDIEDAFLALERCQLETSKLKRLGKITRRGVKGYTDINFPSNLPMKWILKKIKELYQIGAIFDFQDGNHGELYPRKTDFDDSGVRFLTATQVLDNQVLLDEAPFLKQEKASQLRIGFVKSHDVLLTHNATVGRVAIMPDVSEIVILGTSVTYYRLNKSYINPNFCSIMMQGPLWQDQLKKIMEQTTRNQVSITKQAEFYLEIPPLEEQHEIVRRVESLFALADRIEQRVSTGKERADRLTQAILAKAFRGELVPTEAELAREEGRSYEPAGVLLERILEERDEKNMGKKRGKRMSS